MINISTKKRAGGATKNMRTCRRCDVNDRSAWVTGGAAQCCSPLCAVRNWGAVRLTPIWPNWPLPSLITDPAQLWALCTEFFLEDVTVLPLSSTQFSSLCAVDFHPNKLSWSLLSQISYVAEVSLFFFLFLGNHLEKDSNGKLTSLGILWNHYFPIFVNATSFPPSISGYSRKNVSW